MTLSNVLSADLWPLASTIIFLLALSVFGIRRRSIPAAFTFSLASGFSALLVIGVLLQHAAIDPADKEFWFSFAAFWEPAAVVAISCFILEYAWPGRWPTLRNLALLMVPWFIVLALRQISDFQPFTWPVYAAYSEASATIRSFNWLLFLYSGLLGLAELVVMSRLFIRSPQHRWVVVMLIAVQLGVRILFVISALNLVTVESAWGVILLAGLFSFYAIVLFAFRISDPISLAENTVIDQMLEGLIVLDPQGRISSINPAGLDIFGVSQRYAVGRSISSLLPWVSLEKSETREISLPAGPGTRHFTLECSTIKDWRGLIVGNMLLLRDITEQKNANAQLVEQQSALAKLQEREEMARELHDNLGQVFSYINMQGQTVKRLVQRGDVSTASAKLNRMVEIVRETEIDLCKPMLEQQAALLEQGLIVALDRYLALYGETFGMITQLEVSEDFPSSAFTPQIETQLLRILQEALTNTRKHAAASKVCVSFRWSNERASIDIRDNGHGFDIQEPSLYLNGHFGLRMMRERTEEIGGNLRVLSAPGQGTMVQVTLPMLKQVIS